MLRGWQLCPSKKGGAKIGPTKRGKGTTWMVLEETLRNTELIARRFPIMEHGLSMGGYSGLYDVTPDKQPVLGPIPEYAGLFADFGWSGHGFKHSPVIGDILSDVILHGRSAAYDIMPFRWSRFREGDVLPSAHGTAPPHDKLREAAPRKG